MFLAYSNPEEVSSKKSSNSLWHTDAKQRPTKQSHPAGPGSTLCAKLLKDTQLTEDKRKDIQIKVEKPKEPNSKHFTQTTEEGALGTRNGTLKQPVSKVQEN